MNARFVAGLAVAAIPIMSLLGTASASADTTIEGKYHNTVDKYNDPQAIFGNGRSVVRAADMADVKRFPRFAAPFDPRELAAIGQSWDNSFCHDADERVSERCLDRGH